MPMIIESTKICAQEVGDELYICSVIMGPMNCASQIRGVETLMFDFMDRPEFAGELLDFCTDLEIMFGKELIDAGAHSLIIGEALCSPAFISPKLYHDFVVPRQEKLIAAICASPSILSKLGILDNRKATIYPGMEREIPKPRSGKVVVDGHVITSEGPGTAVDFTLEIIKTLLGKDKANEIKKEIVYR